MSEEPDRIDKDEILKTRKEWGFSREEFGTIIGVDGGTIKSYEEGEIIPTPKKNRSLEFLRDFVKKYETKFPRKMLLYLDREGEANVIHPAVEWLMAIEGELGVQKADW